MIPVFLIVIIIIVVIFLLLLWGYNNRFVVLDNRIRNSFAQIDVQLKKRADLVPNLMESVKGYMKHEQKMIREVTEARKALVSANNTKDMAKRIKAGDMLQNALKSIFAIAENYPKLRANENFLHLQQELSAIEDKVAYARQFYNDSILAYENSIKMFPGSLFAGILSKKAKEFMKIPEAERKPVKVKF
ncbi:MAG: LemA family protein [archaeon]|nr:MAG: LemA family protein [archaeon]